MFLIDEASDTKSINLDFFDIFNKYWPIITIAFFIILIIIFYFRVKNNMIRISKERMNQNNNNNKYIKDVYIEIGDSAEKLRFFSNKKMRKLAVNHLKIMLSDRVGKIIAKYCHIKSWHHNIFQLNSNLNKINNFFEKSNDELDNLAQFAKHNSYYGFKDRIDYLRDLASLYSKKIMIVKGNAGSGKTNLICDFCKSLLRRKEHFIYINCRDVNDDIESYFENSFFINKNDFLKNKAIAKHLYFLNRFFLRKKTYVIFEGVNESEKTAFGRELINFINDTNFHFIRKNVLKFIISTREEHFSYSFEKDINDNLTNKELIVLNNLSMIDVNNSDFDNIIKKYCDYFNYSGSISTDTKNIISTSFFMIRLFFELYSNTKDNVDISNSQQIFQAYINELTNKVVLSNGILRDISKIMIENKKFDGVPYEEIIKHGYTESNIDNLISNSALICKNINYNENSNLSYSSPCLTIVFDEFRDFLLASYIKSQDNAILIFKDIVCDNNEVLYTKIKKYRSSVRLKDGYTCKEGVTKYLYLSYRIDNDIMKCKEILRINEVSNIFVWYKKYNVNFLTSLILESCFELNDFEIDYIGMIPNYNADAYLVFDYLFERLYKDDSKIIKIFNEIHKTSFKYCFNNYKSRDFKRKLDDQINKGYSNTIVINSLSYILNQIIVREDEKKDFIFNPEFIDYKYKFSELYDHFYNYYWNPMKEFKKYYKKSFIKYEDYLLSHYDIKIADLEKFNRVDLRFKYAFSNSDNSILNILRNDAIMEVISEVVKKHYED